VLNTTLQSISQEAVRNWQNEENRGLLLQNLPPVVALLFVAAVLILRGRPMIEGYALRLQKRSSSRGRELWAFVASLGQVIVPTLGVYAVATAIVMSGILGPLGDVVAQSLPKIGFGIFLARWLGEQIFPKVVSHDAVVVRSDDLRSKGRTTTWLLGLIIGVETLRTVLLPEESMSAQAAAVLAFPNVLLAGLLLFRLGRILRQNKTEEGSSESVSFTARMIGISGRALMVVAVLGPLLAAVGYVAAGAGLVFPAAMSIGLLGVVFILQRLTGLLYALILRSDETARDALAPVLIGFTLAIASIPLFALIWGARVADITEVITQFREGFQIGETRISPSDFVLLAVIFGFGFLMTRLFQGALKSTILPKTKLDQGGQNAIVAGVGYIGIFLASLVGINAAGIDLSGLAIVAGALSVGLGFGLQNIVSNFVSGIILLIERPVSEGDWIEVGGVMGTVKSISVRSTRIQTFDRTDVIVPNADLVSGMVTNWTRFSLNGRLIVKVGVAYGTDTRKVEKILQEIAEAQPLAVMNPPPVVVLTGFGADSLDFEIRVILRDVNFSLTVRSEINHEIARRFVEEGIEIPFAQRDIWLRNPEVLTQLLGQPATGPVIANVSDPRGAV
jgi:small-conductance mechanosensitive channel